MSKGLGKGLGALLSVFDEDEGGGLESVLKASTIKKDIVKSEPQIVTRVTKEPEVIEIDITSIDNNPNQPRKEFVHEKLEELAESIRANGVIQPIILCPVGTRFMIVAGERRWRAAKIAGIKKIPAVVRRLTPSQIAEVAIVENLQREGLNEIELARGIKLLIDEFKLTQEQAATRLGKNRSHIAHTLRLLTLPAEVIKLVEQNQLSAGHARCLVTLTDKAEALRLARLCVQNDLSVRELERLLRDKQSTATLPAIKRPQLLELKELQRELTELFRTKVAVSGDNTKGRIIIDYFGISDLLRIRKHTIDVNKLMSVDETVKRKIQGKL